MCDCLWSITRPPSHFFIKNGLLSTLGLRSKFVNVYLQVNLPPSNKTCVLPIILEYRFLLQIGKNDIIIHNIIWSHCAFIISFYWIFLGLIVLVFHSLPWPIKCMYYLNHHRQRKFKTCTTQISAIFTSSCLGSLSLSLSLSLSIYIYIYMYVCMKKMKVN